MAEKLTSEICEILCDVENRRMAQESDWIKWKKKSEKKIAFIVLVIVGTIVGIGICNKVDFYFWISVFCIIAVFFCAILIVLYMDKKRISPDYEDAGLWVENAYILNAFHYRGERLLIAYYDHIQNIFHTQSISIDTSDVDGRCLKAGDFVDIIVKVKRGRVHYVGIL